MACGPCRGLIRTVATKEVLLNGAAWLEEHPQEIYQFGGVRWDLIQAQGPRAWWMEHILLEREDFERFYWTDEIDISPTFGTELSYRRVNPFKAHANRDKQTSRPSYVPATSVNSSPPAPAPAPPPPPSSPPPPGSHLKKNTKSFRASLRFRYPPKPRCCQSNLPLPPQRVCYFEVEIDSISTRPRDTLISIGVATKPWAPHVLPGLLPASLGILSSGFIHGYPSRGRPYRKGCPQLREGDVVGCLVNRDRGLVGFLLNGGWLAEVVMEEVRLTWSGPAMFVTIGMLGDGELEVNFGRKHFVGSGDVMVDLPRGIKARLKEFYEIHNPVMLCQVDRIANLYMGREKELDEELTSHYGAGLSNLHEKQLDVVRRRVRNFFELFDPSKLTFEDVDDMIKRHSADTEEIHQALVSEYGVGLDAIHNRRKISLQRMLNDYFKLKGVETDTEGIKSVVNELFSRPEVLDTALREKFGDGLNYVLKKKLTKLYTMYAPDQVHEVDRLLNAYAGRCVDGEFELKFRLKERYAVDLDLISVEPSVDDGQTVHGHSSMEDTAPNLNDFPQEQQTTTVSMVDRRGSGPSVGSRLRLSHLQLSQIDGFTMSGSALDLQAAEGGDREETDSLPTLMRGPTINIGGVKVGHQRVSVTRTSRLGSTSSVPTTTNRRDHPPHSSSSPDTQFTTPLTGEQFFTTSPHDHRSRSALDQPPSGPHTPQGGRQTSINTNISERRGSVREPSVEMAEAWLLVEVAL
ncbi:unnamed protein product [Vitrella brassicaformis CCMP3155]|uniref:B30.2/SPRY domain-containing protein n=1 Tax=Vitrella brassicaformis (strain CCMP3155) TaxID=1169540 RepID=A0A0G4EK42_VITBC|nr:unnamed protein product [Vitrella brassicaformis CCMP3155]|eukprot:CEL97805.1 unnamed protein product [Vitrella brassicaformis CCMP3155]